MPNCPTFIIYYFAMLKAGGTVVNYNPLYTLDELTFQVKDSETELMVTLDLKLLFDKVEALMAAGTLKRAVVASLLRSAARRQSPSCSSCSRAGSSPTPTSRRWPPTSSSTPTCSRNAGTSSNRRNRSVTTTSPCCSTPAAPPARPRAPC